ncbi:MAG: UTRA domain-containing protein, partial [Pseudomonadota bacterium]|nr:UTRA domain-containing protein [Pseudomonadota bacterium]
MIKNITVIDAVKTVNEALKIDKNAALIYIERVRIVEDRVILSERIWLPESRYQDFIGLEPEDFENLLYPF